MKPTKIDIAVIEKAKAVSNGWITEDRWIKYAYFGYRYKDNVDTIKPSRIRRLSALGLVNLVKIEGNYAYYKCRAGTARD